MKTAITLVPTLVLTSAFGIGVLAGACKTTEQNAEHCSNNDGDRYCAEASPDRPFCSNGNDASCNAGYPTGCVSAEDLVQGCADPCGSLSPEECEGVADDSSSGGSGTATGETDEPMTTTGETGSTGDTGTTTTGPMPCGGDDDCNDPAAPFCGPEGECVDCSGMTDPGAACAGVDPGRPVCDNGECVECTDQDPGACGGNTPVCGENNLCQACTEHSQCPGSACHLDGPDAGSCFDLATSTVVMAANTAALEAAFTDAQAGDDVIVVLTGMNYSDTSIDFTTAAEVAVIGDGSETISGNNGTFVVNSAASSIVYVSAVTIGGNLSGSGLGCSGTSLWIDDSQVSGNTAVGMTISGGCAAHLRRTLVRSNNAGGIDVSGSELHMHNSVVAANGNNLAATIGGLRVDGTALDISYSTIVGNIAASASRSTLRCLGLETGTIRNSILVATGGTIDNCTPGLFANNAVDTAVGGSNVLFGGINPDWFPNVGVFDFHLGLPAGMELQNIAMWQAGDPLTDIDGDPIPMGMPSYPGYDQP